MPIILKIAVPVPINQLFDFLTNPSEAQERYQPGCRVAIPFGARTLVGVIFEVTDHSDLALKKIKPILKLLDNHPLLSADIMKLIKWSATYYHHPIGGYYSTSIACFISKPRL